MEDIFLEDINNIAGELKEFYSEIEGKTILIAGGRGFLGTPSLFPAVVYEITTP